MTSIPIKIGVLTVSDRCSKGQAEDTSGDNLSSIVEAKEDLPDIWRISLIRECVPDELIVIKDCLLDW